MAKRLTDTDKWKREWFYDLSTEGKLIWIYLLDQCDHRGVWFRNFKLMKDQLGFEVSAETLHQLFGDKITFFDDDKYFIPSFVEFQYGELNPNNKAHKGVIELLNSLKNIAPMKLLGSPSKGAQDKDIDNNNINNSNNSVKIFDERFSAENQPFVKRLNELQIKSSSIFNKIFLVRKRFETVEELDKWVTGISESKGFREKPTPYGKQQYLAACLINECGMAAS